MKYTINGKSARQVAIEKGLSEQTFYARLGRMAVAAALYKGNLYSNSTYTVSKDGQRLLICSSMKEVADFFGVTKNTIVGLFYRHGNLITVDGCTCERKGGENELAKGL